MVGWYGWWQYDRISEQRQAVEALDEQIKNEKEFYKDNLEPIVARVAKLDPWAKSDVNLLDEMIDLSVALRPKPHAAEDFPADQDVVVTSLNAASIAGGGRIKFDLAAKEKDLAFEIEKRVRENGDTFIAEGVADTEESRPGYKWTLPNATVHVAAAKE
jgi:hypothetical protein